jgi:3D (Asp-Asp-Asp) domain-containing protein
VLGASSVDDALSSLDSLDRIAAQDRQVIVQTREAQSRYAELARALAARERRLQSLADQAAQSAVQLGQARAERASYVAGLAARRSMNAAAISSLEQQAAAVEAKARRLASLTAARPAPASGFGGGVAPGSRTLTVVATGYSLGGRTSTGAPVGWGVVAVDPSIIPLGTRLTIPGYGEGVAADTGSAVRGATIDLWFTTRAQAGAWGRRTVTITLR